MFARVPCKKPLGGGEGRTRKRAGLFAINRFLLLNVTKEQLEAQTAFNRDTYKDDRDNQRMVVKAS